MGCDLNFAPLNLTTTYGVFWGVLGHFVIFLKCFWVFWDVLNVGIFGCFWLFWDVFYNVLEVLGYFRTFWDVLGCFGTFKTFFLCHGWDCQL